VKVAVSVGVWVAVKVAVGVAVSVGVDVGVKVAVGVGVSLGIRVGVSVSVAVGVKVKVRVGERVMVGEAVTEAVEVGWSASSSWLFCQAAQKRTAAIPAVANAAKIMAESMRRIRRPLTGFPPIFLVEQPIVWRVRSNHRYWHVCF
jgi:hypothetical protein